PLAVADSTLPLAAFPFDTLTFRITRAHVPLQHIRFAGITGNRALYIRLDDFGAGAFEQFAGIFDSLTEIEPEYSGVLIDLRDNPGGLLGEALDMTDFFLEKDVLMLGRVGRSRWSRREISSSGDDETGGAPTLILVNGSSASASEVFSGALKFASRARLVGDTTYGKGLVQEYNTLSDGSASRLSAARYYFTGQRYLNEPGAEKKDSGSGLAPDYAYDFSDANGFVRALEARVMLVPFAARYQDWIISSYDKGEYRDVITELENFVRLSGFIYESESLDRATNLFVTSKLKGVDSESRELVESILRRARNVEKNMFTRNSEKIMRRLARLAYERREGARAAFLAVDLLHDPDLKYCERLLLDSLRNGS
ncbi:MAG: S41 family peptidase, partial [Candidatus Zixiibacteriota bacterium]